MINIYSVLCRVMSNENAARLALILSIVLWFAVGAVAGLMVSYILPVDKLNAMVTGGCWCSLVVGCIGEMFVILRSE